jgi:phosphatidylethanolamine-binding protein (PEBP) family uncharacterized protein
MSKKLFHLGVAICFTGCVACTSQDPVIDPSKLQKIGVGYRRAEQDICKDGKRSPKITVTDLPAGVCPPNGHRYRISLIARNTQQETIAYGEKTIIAERGPGAH